jgi:hypothetical protein
MHSEAPDSLCAGLGNRNLVSHCSPYTKSPSELLSVVFDWRTGQVSIVRVEVTVNLEHAAMTCNFSCAVESCRPSHTNQIGNTISRLTTEKNMEAFEKNIQF